MVAVFFRGDLPVIRTSRKIFRLYRRQGIMEILQQRSRGKEEY